MLDDRPYWEKPGHFIAACVALGLLDIIAIALRIYIRLKQRVAFRTDDWLATIAAVRKHANLRPPYMR
jgi:hypothetical protein